MRARISKLNPFSQKEEASPARKRLMYILKIGFTFLILYLITRRIDLAAAWQQIISLPLSLAAVVFLISILRHSIQFTNWNCALRLNGGYKFVPKEVLASYLVALPLRFVIPGGHAAMGKIFYLNNSSLMASLISTTAERLVMTWATWTFASMAAFFFFPDVPLYLRILAVGLAAFSPLLVALNMRWHTKSRIHLPAFTLQAPRMMILQVGSTLLTYLQYYLILNHLGVISYANTWLLMGLTNFSNSIPITIAGLGLREGFAIHFLNFAGFMPEQAVAATLSLFFFQDVLPALPGLIVLAKGRK